jgi:hypothetical protein
MEVGQGPNWGCSAKEKKSGLLYITISAFTLENKEDTKRDLLGSLIPKRCLEPESH